MPYNQCRIINWSDPHHIEVNWSNEYKNIIHSARSLDSLNVWRFECRHLIQQIVWWYDQIRGSLYNQQINCFRPLVMVRIINRSIVSIVNRSTFDAQTIYHSNRCSDQFVLLSPISSQPPAKIIIIILFTRSLDSLNLAQPQKLVIHSKILIL